MSIVAGADSDGGNLAEGAYALHDVAALLVTADGRYLMQLRDDKPGLRVAGHWGLFGGRVEAGETARQALYRELEEELEFTPNEVDWFTESAFILPQFGVGKTLKSFFVVPVRETDLQAMVQHEGAAMKLFSLEELFRETRVVPWDIYGILLHARRDQTFRVTGRVTGDWEKA